MSARRAASVDDPVTGLPAEVRFLQPHQARKAYLCPGCNQLIPALTGHVVVVPLEAADLRRHWHRPCWDARDRRRPGRLRRPGRA